MSNSVVETAFAAARRWVVEHYDEMAADQETDDDVPARVAWAAADHVIDTSTAQTLLALKAELVRSTEFDGALATVHEFDPRSINEPSKPLLTFWLVNRRGGAYEAALDVAVAGYRYPDPNEDPWDSSMRKLMEEE